MPANLENSAVATGLENFRFHSNPKERNAKECSNYPTIALISHASKLMLKILQARLQQYVNHTLAEVQEIEKAGFLLSMSIRSSKKARVPEKYAFLLY